MGLVFRRFRACRGWGVELIRRLSSVASDMVRSLQAESVVICRRPSDPEQVTWIGDRGTELDFKRLPHQALIVALENIVAESVPPVSLRLLDEFYRFPPPLYQVWALEVGAPGEGRCHVLEELFDLSRSAQRDARTVGMSLYRRVEDPGVFAAFLGLVWGLTPSSLVWNGRGPYRMAEGTKRACVWKRAYVWHPISVACEMRRLTPVERGTPDRNEVARAPFWIRSGLLTRPCSAMGAAEESPSKRGLRTEVELGGKRASG